MDKVLCSNMFIKELLEDFPGVPVVKNLPSSAGDVGLIPGQGTKIPHVHAKSLQLCQTLCDPMDSSPPGSSVYRILQARILKWVAVPSSRESSWPRNGTPTSYVSCNGREVLYHLAPPGKLKIPHAVGQKSLRASTREKSCSTMRGPHVIMKILHTTTKTQRSQK